MTYEKFLQQFGYSIESGKQTPMFTYRRWVNAGGWTGDWSGKDDHDLMYDALHDFMSRVPLSTPLSKKRSKP